VACLQGRLRQRHAAAALIERDDNPCDRADLRFCLAHGRSSFSLNGSGRDFCKALLRKVLTCSPQPANGSSATRRNSVSTPVSVWLQHTIRLSNTERQNTPK
jgi:hypothetical protein